MFRNLVFRNLVLRTPQYLICAVTPLAILEYKYNRSHDELLANVLKEDKLTYSRDSFEDGKNIYQKEIEEIRKSSRQIKHWQSSGPREQLFTPIPKRWNKD